MSDRVVRYRVLAEPQFEHDRVSPEHPDGGEHSPDCADDYVLEVWLPPTSADPTGLRLGRVRLGARGALDLREARDTVDAWLRTKRYVAGTLDVYVKVIR